MKFGQTYTDLTKNPVETKEESTTSVAQNNEDAARKQAHFLWQASTVTQEMVEAIQKEIKDLTDSSVRLAVNYPNNPNHQQIIQQLVKIDTLRGVLKTYVSNS